MYQPSVVFVKKLRLESVKRILRIAFIAYNVLILSMGSIRKSLALVLILIVAISSLSLLMVEPANSQAGGQTPNYSDYIITPTVPQFTLSFIQSTYGQIITDPYTGINTNQQVNNSTIEVTIKNQPFSPYYYSYEYKGSTITKNTSLWYNVQIKGHYSQDWTDIYLDNSPTYYSTQLNTQSNSSDYTVITLPQAAIIDPASYPKGGDADFRVRAITGGWFPPVLSSLINLPMNYISKNSSWSNTKTIRIGGTSSSASPNPTQTPTVTPSPPSDRNAPHLDPVVYLIPVSVIVAVVAVSVLLFRKHQKKPLT